MTPGKIWRVGAGLAVLYLVVVVVTMAAVNHPVRPLFDGLIAPPPYQWVNPPPAYGTNVKPERTTVTVALTDAGSVAAGPTSTDGQVVLNLPNQAIPRRDGASEVRITIIPKDAARLGSMPPNLLFDGNAYEIRMTYRPSGGNVGELDRPGNIVLATPEPASVLLFAPDGHRWEVLDTQRVGGPDSVGGTFRQAGHYVAAIPGVAPPSRQPSGWLETGRQVLIVILSAALAINLVRRARERAERDRGPEANTSGRGMTRRKKRRDAGQTGKPFGLGVRRDPYHEKP